MDYKSIILYAAADSGRVNIRFSAEAWEDFKSACTKHDVSTSAVMRELVKDFTHNPLEIQAAPRRGDERNRNIRIPAGDLARFKNVCAERGLLMSDVVRTLIEEFTEKAR